MNGANGDLIPLKNNAVGKMTGFEVIIKNLINIEHFPFDNQTKGFNVRLHNIGKIFNTIQTLFYVVCCCINNGKV